jgi:hypothetical protein
MANAGPDSNRSQFFITIGAATHLDGKHSIFGAVVGGSNILDRMAEVTVDHRSQRPSQLIKILDVVVFQSPLAEADQMLEGKIQANQAKRAGQHDPTTTNALPAAAAAAAAAAAQPQAQRRALKISTCALADTAAYGSDSDEEQQPESSRAQPQKPEKNAQTQKQQENKQQQPQRTTAASLANRNGHAPVVATATTAGAGVGASAGAGAGESSDDAVAAFLRSQERRHVLPPGSGQDVPPAKKTKISSSRGGFDDW